MHKKYSYMRKDGTEKTYYVCKPCSKERKQRSRAKSKEPVSPEKTKIVYGLMKGSDLYKIEAEADPEEIREVYTGEDL
jgi:hypothetical protein